MKETTHNTTISWIKLLLRTLTWDKIIIFWILGLISFFIIYIIISPPPPPDISYFNLIIGVIEKLIGWVIAPLVSCPVIGSAGSKIINAKKDMKNE